MVDIDRRVFSAGSLWVAFMLAALAPVMARHAVQQPVQTPAPPKGPFNLFLRAYPPDESLVRQSHVPPPVTKLP